MAQSLFNFSRTASMAVSKKQLSGSKQQYPLQGRRHTMMQQPTRDSVLSNGSSDRSSSVSDENFISPPALPANGLFSLDMEERMREAWPIKCCFVVKEIMQTEIAYIQSLADIIKGYLTPLYSHLLTSGESPNFIKTVFSNVIKIHQTHQELMESFHETCLSPHDFGSTFLRVDFLSLYTVYCTSYSQGNKCLEQSTSSNQSLREFIEHCQHELGHSLPLTSQLIKPVQRILKYRLLLEELNKHFDIHHPAYKTIKAAVEKMSTVAEQINTSFTNPKNSSKGAPSAVARKRTNQIRDLQKSRSAKDRRNPSHEPFNSRLSHRSISETHLHRPPVEFEGLEAGWSAERHGLADSMPRVQQLRSFFEQLCKEEEESVRQRVHSGADGGGMRKASSMAGSKKDSISTAGVSDSPPPSITASPTRVSSSFSKSPFKSPFKKFSLKSPSRTSSGEQSPTKFRRRRSSCTLVDFKSDSNNDSSSSTTTTTVQATPTTTVEEIVAQPGKVADEIKRHIAAAKALRAAQEARAPRTLV